MMKYISLKENEKDIKKSDLENIRDITLKEIKENKNVLIYPQNLSVDKELFKVSDNLIGFIKKDDATLHIKSRFGGEKDYFVQYMLCKVLGLDILKLSATKGSVGDIESIAMMLLPQALIKAERQGIYRSYEHFKRNDDKVHGAIDIARHIKQNPVFCGKIAYQSREKSYDNNITQLIRHTLEYMKSSVFGANLLSTSSEIHKIINAFNQATPSYSPQKRVEIIKSNIKPLYHPYFSEYEPLRKICMMILRKQGFGSAINTNGQMFGIIIDIATLWEEYLWKLLEPLEFKHPNNRTKKDKIYACKNPNDFYGFHYYPDFYKKNIVLDAKYKNLHDNTKEKSNFREDFEKMLIYMFLLKAKNGIFVYPSNGQIEDEEAKLKGYGGNVAIYPFAVSTKDELEEFCNEMTEQEENFKNYLKKIPN